MAPTPTVGLRKDNGFYYTAIGGKKIKLLNQKEAQRLFHDLMAKEQEPTGAAISNERRGGISVKDQLPEDQFQALKLLCSDGRESFGYVTRGADESYAGMMIAARGISLKSGSQCRKSRTGCRGRKRLADRNFGGWG